MVTLRPRSRYARARRANHRRLEVRDDGDYRAAVEGGHGRDRCLVALRGHDESAPGHRPRTSHRNCARRRSSTVHRAGVCAADAVCRSGSGARAIRRAAACTHAVRSAAARPVRAGRTVTPGPCDRAARSALVVDVPQALAAVGRLTAESSAPVRRAARWRVAGRLRLGNRQGTSSGARTTDAEPSANRRATRDATAERPRAAGDAEARCRAATFT